VTNPISIAYADVKVGDRIWNKLGFSTPRGHWTLVVSVRPAASEGYIAIGVSDGYEQIGHAREGIGVLREAYLP
jgi:hypothetical protein